MVIGFETPLKEIDNLKKELAAERRAHFYTKQNLLGHQQDEERLNNIIHNLKDQVEIFKANEESIQNFLRNF